jgi:hypothetical protein
VRHAEQLKLLHMSDIEHDGGFASTGVSASANYRNNPCSTRPQANFGSKSNPHPKAHKRRHLVQIPALISHPDEGLILFETSSGKNWATVWDPPFNDLFAHIESTADKEIHAATSETGHSINEVRAVILGYLYLNHAGGFGYFVNTDAEIYVHESERKHALY